MAQNTHTGATRRRGTAWWVLGALLAAFVFMPQLVISLWGASLASRLLTRQLNRPVSIQEVSGGWLGGLEVRKLVIADGFQANAKTLLEVGRMRIAGPVWMLVLPGGAIDVVVDGLRLQLRRLPDGEWNVAALQPTGDLQVPERLPLPGSKVNFRLTSSQIYLEPEERTYVLTAKADSSSMASQPLQWSIELSTRDGSSLSARGSFGNLATPKTIAGRATLEMKRLDLEMIPPLVPQLPVMYPHGIVEEGEVRLDLAGVTQFHAVATFDLRDISLPDIGRETAARLSRGSIRLAMTRDNDKWTLDTLSLEGPDGSLGFAPGGWFELSDEAWRGKLDFRVELRDTKPASRALAMLLPDPLLLSGPLNIRTSVDGAVSLDAQKSWPERLASLKANVELSLARAQWGKEPLANIVARVDLDKGHVTVSHLGASISKGYASVQGDLTIGDNPGGGLSWLVADVSLANLLDPHVLAFDITKATGRLTFDGTTYRVESETAIRKLAVDRKALAGRELRVDDASLKCAGTLPPTFTRVTVTSCRLKAVQGDLLSNKGRIDLGTTPKLQLDLGGWLSGPFLNALVPEITATWPPKLNLKGPLTVPFTGKTWVDTEWQLDVNGKDFVYADLEFTNLQARVTKSVGRLDFNVSGRRGPGSITATGSLELEGPATATVELKADRIAVRHVQALADYRQQGPGNLVTETRVSGRVLLTRVSGGNPTAGAELETESINRRIFRQNEKVSEVALPPLRAALKLISGNSLEQWTVASFTVQGQGAQLSLTDGQLARKDSGYEVAGLLTLELSPEFLQGLAMGQLSARLDLNGTLKAAGRTMWRIALVRPFAPADIDYSGTVDVEKLKVDADTLSAVHLAVRLAGGRLDIQKGEASLLGGRLWVPSPAQVNLRGPAHDFNIHLAAKGVKLKTYGGRQVSLGRFLGLLIPVFLFTSDSDEKPVNVTGVLQFDLRLGGTYQKIAGWSRSVNGNGSFRIDDGAVEGSSLVSGIIARSLLMPTNVVNNSIAALFSKDGKVGRELVDLGEKAFRFHTIQSPITITNGDIFLDRNLKVSSPELNLTINGHSNLEGDLDYNVDSDLIRRVRFGEITDLPNKIPVIGKVLSFLNPFTYLDGIELRARVTGNVLKSGPDGKSEVRVETSVVDTKAG